MKSTIAEDFTFLPKYRKSAHDGDAVLKHAAIGTIPMVI
jgi:hypothetical protein